MTGETLEREETRHPRESVKVVKVCVDMRKLVVLISCLILVESSIFIILYGNFFCGVNFCVSVGSSSSSYTYLFPFCFFVVSEGETLETRETRHPNPRSERERVRVCEGNFIDV